MVSSPSTNATQFYLIKLASPVAQLSQTRCVAEEPLASADDRCVPHLAQPSHSHFTDGETGELGEMAA